MSNPILEATLRKRDRAQAKMDALLATPTAEKRCLTDIEARFFEDLAAQIKKSDKQVADLKASDKRLAAAATASIEGRPGKGGVVVRREAFTYDKHGENSYFRDLAHIAVATKDINYSGLAEEARRRLFQHSHEVEVEARSSKKLARRLHEITHTPASLLEKRVTPNTTAGTGGEMVPPLWLVSQYVPFARPTRTFANRTNLQPLPAGIDVINIPKITVGSQTGIQTAQNSAVTSVDFQTSTVSGTVNTIAGQVDISLQLLEQSPVSIGMDGVIFDDLSRDYDQRLDLQVIGGSGVGGQHLGVLNVTQATSNTSITKANGITVTSPVFHDTSTAGTQYRSIVNGVNQIEVLRLVAPSAIWAHPRRTNSWAFASDTTARPLFTTFGTGQFNVLGLDERGPTPEGVAGALFGLPVVKDSNMPTTMNSTSIQPGVGTADPIVVVKEDDLFLYEGVIRMRTLPEVLSGILAIRYQLYAYSAFIPTRFPPSISILTGNAGMIAPGF